MEIDRGDNNCEYYYHCTRYAVRHDYDGRKSVGTVLGILYIVSIDLLNK